MVVARAVKVIQWFRGSRLWSRFRKKRSDLIGLFGELASFGSWGYTVLNPQPQLAVGLILMGIAFVCFAAILIQLFEFKWKGTFLVLIVVAGLFWVYTRKVVISPLYKRELLSRRFRRLRSRS